MAFILSALVLSWPALFNGSAFFFPDTQTYLRGAGSTVYEITGWENDWSDRHQLIESAAQERSRDASEANSLARKNTPKALHPVLLGRSVYYGLFLFPFVILFGSFGGVLIQGAAASVAVWLSLRCCSVSGDRAPAMLVLTSSLLAALTSLPFFVSLLMPDVFTGLGVLLAVVALFGWHRLDLWEKGLLFLLGCMAAVFHSSNVLIFLTLLLVGLVASLRIPAVHRTGLALLLTFAVVGVASERLFIAGVTSRLGHPPIRPPFLTARLIAEGPGTRLLRDRCPQIGLEACHYLDRIPRDSDAFLWSPDPSEGVFSVESHAVQRRLAAQDGELAFAAFRAYPIEVIRQSAVAAVQQLGMLKADIVNLPVAVQELPPRYAREVSRSRSGAGDMPMQFAESSIFLTTLLGAFAVILVSIGLVKKEHQGAALLLVAGVLANAAVTGSLSKPHDRYNVRLMWVLPLMAGIILTLPRKRERGQC